VARDPSGDPEKLRNIIATDAPVVPGDSGGPLENARNDTVGMVTAGSLSVVHRGFAITIRQALVVAHQIERGKASATVHVGPTAFLGVVLKDVSGGAAITQIVPGQAAASAGLVAGDVMTSLDGTPISSSADVRQVVLSLVPGTAVSVGWKDSGGTAHTGTITPSSGPPQ
jgi:S1-C subfamily serine protease